MDNEQIKQGDLVLTTYLERNHLLISIVQHVNNYTGTIILSNGNSEYINNVCKAPKLYEEEYKDLYVSRLSFLRFLRDPYTIEGPDNLCLESCSIDIFPSREFKVGDKVISWVKRKGYVDISTIVDKTWIYKDRVLFKLDNFELGVEPDFDIVHAPQELLHKRSLPDSIFIRTWVKLMDTYYNMCSKCKHKEVN